MKTIKKIGKVSIINNQVIKEDNDNEKIYKYLKNIDYKHFLPYIKRENNTSIYKYIEDASINNNEKIISYIKKLALLHSKTSEIREIDKTRIIEIKDNIIGYTNHLEKYYNELLKIIEIKTYPSPSNTILLKNYKYILQVLDYIRNETQNWFDKILEINKTRVSLIHNNVSLDHYIENETGYIISWDKAKYDTPVIDIIELYKKYWKYYEFKSLLDIYLEKSKLNDIEIKLLFINIAIPPKYKETNNELENISKINDLFNYISKTEELIRPYYLIEKKE